MKYNIQNLENYCQENNILLITDYTKNNINRESYLEGKCKTENCIFNFNKCFRQLVKIGPYCPDCSIKRGNEKIREQKCKYDYKMLIEFCQENKIILTEDYSSIFVNRDTAIKGKCKTENCNHNFGKSFRMLLKLKDYCASCCKELGKEKIKNTNIEKFGCENAMQNKEVREKLTNSIIEKYGVSHISKLDRIKDQKKEKSIEKYGVEYPLQSPKIREKIVNTNIQKYGSENPMQNKEIRDRVQKTVQERYGVDYSCQSQIVKNKTIETNMKNYGVSYPIQNAEFSEKHLKSCYNIKKYTLPSGKIIDYQGYENFAFDELFQKEKIDEKELIISRKDVPVIWYKDKTGKERRHFVDMYLPLQNRCIEVKSTWTNQEKNNVLEKKEAAEKLGYIYEIWIYDKKGVKSTSTF